jgi:hypothetical protein
MKHKDWSKSLLIDTCYKKFDSIEDHTRRTLAYCQSQNKHYRKLYKFVSVGLKRTHIIFQEDLQIISMI